MCWRVCFKSRVKKSGHNLKNSAGTLFFLFRLQRYKISKICIQVQAGKMCPRQNGNVAAGGISKALRGTSAIRQIQ